MPKLALPFRAPSPARLLQVFQSEVHLNVETFCSSQQMIPYAFGADGPDAFDCSGLTEYSYAQVGVTIPRTVAGQATTGIPVRGAFERGDLLFFATDDTQPGVATHVGIFESGTTMIAAPRTGLMVTRRDISTSWWQGRLLFARRISRIVSIELTPSNPSVTVGNTIQLTATARDASGNSISVPPTNFVWSSANPVIAMVNISGLITGVAAGTVPIAEQENSSGKSATVVVTVTPVAMISLARVSSTCVGSDPHFNPSGLIQATFQVAAPAGTGLNAGEVGFELFDFGSLNCGSGP